ncbi:D-alanyl-D-alanine carboxypeptidase [Maribacter sp. MMG018]|uniref:D-alanyl-D-alanine carboxypeptidase n=1 Tax=Maribacter sp. MMG018 TaxID=2822688 RepID=UPI001B37378F|nr:D-alanyl-D-alanine carboxypeptidase [Maribacter sp. MMG018]MBQ4914737.1 D-alanyl-D-alanine carboxypeptidase [Maribacter sp. MMG018]
MKNNLLLFIIACVTISCAGLKNKNAKAIDRSLESAFFKNQFTGLVVIDPVSKDTLYDHNSDNYFIPASNTKIFTLYTALKTLPKKIPALKYIEHNDTLFFEGTGDPSFLHHYLKDSTAFKFLKSKNNLALYPGNFQDTPMGPGWSWDDYEWYYAAERNGFPVYGNVVMLYENPQHTISPNYFEDSVINMTNLNNREIHRNRFYFDSNRKDTLEVPFITKTSTTKAILEHTLQQPISLIPKMPEGDKKMLYGIHADSLYTRLMHESDNFIAEQLLILSSGMLTDTLNSKNARNYILKNDLKGLPQEPRWVDGSGLSRYNLFTPQSMVYVLDQLYKEVSTDRLFNIFPAIDTSKPFTNWHGKTGSPYLFAKSGSMGNIYCLSGYLKTESGKILIFSFMNNNFRNSSADLKNRMRNVFEQLRTGY